VRATIFDQNYGNFLATELTRARLAVCLVAGLFGDPWRRAESKAQGRAANLRLPLGARDAK